MGKLSRNGKGRPKRDGKTLKVLVVEPDKGVCDTLRRHLLKWGFETSLAFTKEEAAGRLAAEKYHLALSEMRLDGGDGPSLLRFYREASPGLPVVFISDEVTVEEAFEAIKAGATDYVSKPIDPPGLRATLERIRRDEDLRCKAERRLARLDAKSRLGPLVGRTKAMRRVFELIRVIADTETPVLIWGETGTGKELAARTIHQLSGRHSGPFVALNSAAVSRDLAESQLFGHEKGAFTGATSSRPGCFELADGGMLFLDEIGEMPLSLQPKLLRVLESKRVRRLGGSRERQFDVRVLAATNREPKEAVRAGKLRRDLFFRLSVFLLEMPALQKRGADIELLAQRFLLEFSQKHQKVVEGIADEALLALVQYRWPGNVRELRNAVERAVVLCNGRWIETRHLPASLDPTGPPSLDGDRISFPIGVSLADAEREIVRRTLEKTGNNKSKTARILEVDVKTVRKKIRDYGLGE